MSQEEPSEEPAGALGRLQLRGRGQPQRRARLPDVYRNLLTPFAVVASLQQLLVASSAAVRALLSKPHRLIRGRFHINVNNSRFWCSYNFKPAHLLAAMRSLLAKSPALRLRILTSQSKSAPSSCRVSPAATSDDDDDDDLSPYGFAIEDPPAGSIPQLRIRPAGSSSPAGSEPDMLVTPPLSPVDECDYHDAVFQQRSPKRARDDDDCADDADAEMASDDDEYQPQLAELNARLLLDLLRAELPDTASEQCVHGASPLKRCFACAFSDSLIGLRNPDIGYHQHVLGPHRKRSRLRLAATTSALSDPLSTSGRKIVYGAGHAFTLSRRRVLDSYARSLGLDGRPASLSVGPAGLNSWGATPQSRRSIRLAKQEYYTSRGPSIYKSVLIQQAKKAVADRGGDQAEVQVTEFRRWYNMYG